MILIFAGALQKIFPNVRVVLYMQLHFLWGRRVYCIMVLLDTRETLRVSTVKYPD